MTPHSFGNVRLLSRLLGETGLYIHCDGTNHVFLTESCALSIGYNKFVIFNNL